MASWSDPIGWQRLRAGDDCPMCLDGNLESNAFSLRVAEMDWSVMRLARNQWCRGWSLVILKSHACELFELSDAELCGFWRDVSRAAQALQSVFQPVKMNYAVYGNLNPHIHCHLVPRYASDDPRAPLEMGAGEVLLAEQDY